MKEIQAEIRRDHIENDSRKDELQIKIQNGLKTAVNPQNSETFQNQSNQPQIKLDSRKTAQSIPRKKEQIVHKMSCADTGIQKQVKYNLGKMSPRL